MTNQTPPTANGKNGVLKLGQQIVGVLPPAFLMLVLINVIFVGFVIWFLDDQMKQRNAFADRLFEKCINTVGPSPK